MHPQVRSESSAFGGTHFIQHGISTWKHKKTQTSTDSNLKVIVSVDTEHFIFKCYIVWLAVSCSLCKYSTAVTSEEMGSDECVI